MGNECLGPLSLSRINLVRRERSIDEINEQRTMLSDRLFLDLRSQSVINDIKAVAPKPPGLINTA